MAFNRNTLGALISKNKILENARKEWAEQNLLASHIEGNTGRVWVPQDADGEYQDLMSKARSPWLKFVANIQSQGIRVTSYTDDYLWEKVWLENSFSARQSFTNYEVVAFGYSYLGLMPTEITGEDRGVSMFPMSALNTYATYDSEFSETPSLVVHRVATDRYHIYDSTCRYEITMNGEAIVEFAFSRHDLGFVPVARVDNTATASPKDKPSSPISEAVEAYKRIVDATFTVEMLLRYGAFPQKWATGGEFHDDEGNPTVRPSVASIIHSPDPETRFGNFSSASVKEAGEIIDLHIKHLATLTSTPPHYLLGAVINTSAEGLQTAETNYMRNLAHRKSAMSEGYLLAFRIAAKILGVERDYKARFSFEDMESRSLAQVADAIVKLKDAGVPEDISFRLIPGVSDEQAQEAADYARARKSAEASIAMTSAVEAKAKAVKTLMEIGYTEEEAYAELRLEKPKL